MAVGDLETLLDEADAAFIEGGVSINACSRDRENAPAVCRAVGCRVSHDRTSVVLLIPKSRAPEFLDAVRFSGQVAVVFTQPSTHRTIQIKGTNAEVLPARKSDASLSDRYADATVAEICRLGYAENLIRALMSCPPEDIVNVAFTPSEAFLQTPGPRAGEPLKH